MKGEFEILATAAPLRTEIEIRLRSAITQGRFHAGERLIERELCEMLGVSRPSLREALRQLEAEELVTLVPNRGPVVSEIGIDEARDIYEIRATLEGLVARLFVRNASDAEVAGTAQGATRAQESRNRQVIRTAARPEKQILRGSAHRLRQPRHAPRPHSDAQPHPAVAGDHAGGPHQDRARRNRSHRRRHRAPRRERRLPRQHRAHRTRRRMGHRRIAATQSQTRDKSGRPKTLTYKPEEV
ncbi:MAG: GntR family transcriptional regulator [Pseudolabrys sp.]